MKTSSEADYGEPQQSSVSGGDDSGSESPYDVPKVAPRGAGDSLGLKLALIPEDQRGETSMRNRRRVFQNRRRSRACDACRLRKTKVC